MTDRTRPQLSRRTVSNPFVSNLSYFIALVQYKPAYLVKKEKREKKRKKKKFDQKWITGGDQIKKIKKTTTT